SPGAPFGRDQRQRQDPRDTPNGAVHDRHLAVEPAAPSVPDDALFDSSLERLLARRTSRSRDGDGHFVTSGVRARAAVLAGLVVATLGVVGPARAATIDVSNTAQLQSAIIAAHDGDVIRLAPGNYAPTRTLSVTQRNLVIQTTGAPGASTILGSA